MKHLVLYIIALSTFTGLGQELTLRVMDEHTDQPVEGAHLRLTGGSDTMYAVSNALGKAVFATTTGGKLTVNHVSYQSKTQTLRSLQGITSIYLSPAKDELEEVIVTGQARPVLASEAVRQVKVIGRERIEQQAAVTLRDLLTNDLNFRITEDAILGSQINLQGLGGAKIKILIDGVPVIGRLDGNIDLGQINLNDIERVEIVEGPMSVQYGTDAVAGTINLITKRKALARPEGKLNGYYETAGRYNFDGSLDFPIGKTYGHLSLGRNFFDGYDPSTENRDLQWNPKEQYFLSAGLQRRFKNVLLRYRGDFFDEEIVNRGAAGSIDSSIVPVDTGAWKYPRALDDYYRTYRLNNALYTDLYLGESMKIKAFAAYNYYKRVKNTLIKNLYSGEETYFTGTDAQDTTVFGMLSSRMFFQHDWFPDKFSYQLGYDFSHEENMGERIENGYRSITDVALFATLEYQPFEKLNIQPGMRYAYNSRFEAPLINSLALRYQPAENWILRASYGQGFRAPSLKELYFLFVDENHNILGNEDLQAESSDNFQLSLNYARAFSQNTVDINLRGFLNNIRNEIRLVSVIEPDEEDPRGLYRNENIARTQTTGGTLSAALNLSKLEIETGATVVGVKNNLAFSEAASDNENNGFNFYPQLRLNIQYNFEKAGFSPALFINYTGQRRDLVTNSKGELVYSFFDPYTMADLTLRKKFWKNRLACSLGIKNLLDVTDLQSSTQVGGSTHSAGSNSVPLSYGRSFFARIQISLP